MIKSDATDSIIDRKISERDEICLELDSNTCNNVLDDQGNTVVGKRNGGVERD